MKRWLVETKPGQFSDVGAQFLAIHNSGALIFMDDPESDPTLVLATGTWVSVCPDDAA